MLLCTDPRTRGLEAKDNARSKPNRSQSRHSNSTIYLLTFSPLHATPQVHPFNTQPSIRTICIQHGITIEAYAPLVRSLKMTHPTIVAISKKYTVTPAQLLVRWSLQHDMVPLPKTTNKGRLVENADVGGFVIEERDMRQMDTLDEHLVTDWDLSLIHI